MSAEANASLYGTAVSASGLVARAMRPQRSGNFRSRVLVDAAHISSARHRISLTYQSSASARSFSGHYCREKRCAWSTTSIPTFSLQAARSCVVMGPGLPSPISRLSTLVMGKTPGPVYAKNASSAVYRS